MLRVCLEEQLVCCLARFGGEAWGVKLSCAGCCWGMSFRGAMYSIIYTPPTASSPSQTISRCLLADPLGTKGGECVELVWLGVFVVF